MTGSKDKATLKFTIIGALGAMVATTTLLMLFLSYQNATKSITLTSQTVMKEVSLRVQEHTTQFMAPVECSEATSTFDPLRCGGGRFLGLWSEAFGPRCR